MVARTPLVIGAAGVPQQLQPGDSLVGASAYLLAGNNLSELASAAAARANLGATTVGSSLFALANPGAITFLRINADNSVAALSGSAFITAIGAATVGPATASGLTISTARLLGRTTAATGPLEEVSVDSSISLTGGVLKAAHYTFAAFFTSVPTASEVLLIHCAGDAFTIPANFASALQSYIGTNPTATFALTLTQNGTTIGTLSVSTSGVVTATTASGTSKAIAAGDVLKLIAPGTPDTTAANMAFTIIGQR